MIALGTVGDTEKYKIMYLASQYLTRHLCEKGHFGTGYINQKYVTQPKLVLFTVIFVRFDFEGFNWLI